MRIERLVFDGVRRVDHGTLRPDLESAGHGLSLRESDFLQQPVLETLRWLRAPGDVVFAGGIVALVVFVFLLRSRPSARRAAATTREDDALVGANAE